MSLLPEELQDRYRVLRELGRGGFGVVLAAEDLQLGRRVAVKLLALSDDVDFAARFQREAQVTASLGHPHVVGVYDYGVAGDGTAYILYELIEGPSLAQEVAADPPGAEAVVRWGVQLAEALQVAHEAGVVHRDVKPGNVLLRGDGQAVLCDFGIAYRPLGRTVVTEAGIRLGTPAYMAPEAILEGETSPAADQFALGATLLEALTGSPVYGAGSLDQVLEKLHSVEPLGRAALSRVPPGLGKVLARALERDPRARFLDLGELARALGSADLRGGGDPRARVGPGPTGHTTTRKRMRPGREPRSRRVIRRVGIGWSVILLAAGVAYGLLSGGPAPVAHPPPQVAPNPEEAAEEARARARRADAAAALDAAVEAWGRPHLGPGMRVGDWLPSADAGHREAAQRQALDADFPRQVRMLERAFLDWYERAAATEDPRYRHRFLNVLLKLLPHIAWDMQALHNRAWNAAFGGDIQLKTGLHRLPGHQQEIEAVSERIAARVGRDQETMPLWSLAALLWMAGNNSVTAPRVEELAETLWRRLEREDPSPHEVLSSVRSLAKAGASLQARAIWDCPRTRVWNQRIARRVVELPRTQDLDMAGIGARAVLALESSMVRDCPGPEADQALLELAPYLEDVEEYVDHVAHGHVTPARIGAVGAELHALWLRHGEAQRDRKGPPSVPVATMLRRTFWLAEKLMTLSAHGPQEPVPEDPRARAAWVRDRLPPEGLGEEGRASVILACWRGLRVMGEMPWALKEALAELSASCRFPGRTYLAGRLRSQMMETESAEERRPMEAALDRITKHYVPQQRWGCAMLRGEMWGNVHSEEAMRHQMSPALSFLSSTNTLGPFLAGAGANAALLLRDCRGGMAEEDLREAVRLLEDGVRGRARGVRSAADAICGLSGFPGEAWTEAKVRDRHSYELMNLLCR